MIKKLLIHICVIQILFSLSIIIVEAKSPQWRKIGNTDDANIFIDMSNISRKKNHVQLWSMEEYLKEKNLKGQKYNSAAIQKVIDCKKSKVTTNYIMFYSGSMGHGDPVDSININYDPMFINPGGINDMIKKILC